MANRHFAAAKRAKNDEFYTRLEDIEKELNEYDPAVFKDKVIFCNCDDPTHSNFWVFFHTNFNRLGLKKLICTHYNMDGSSSYAMTYDSKNPKDDIDFSKGTKIPLKGDGDFRSDECIEYLKQADIVVTNPPFSLAREYVKQLMDNKKDFLIIGNKNWVNYMEVFPLIMYHKIWIGESQPQIFDTPNGKTKKVAGLTRWFTNLPLQKSTDQMVIWKSFDQKEYPAYDNYAAFEVSKVVDIPKDTEITAIIDKDNLQGWKDKYCDDLKVISVNDKTATIHINDPVWAVPITFMDKYNPSSTIVQHNLGKEFDIVGITDRQNTSNWRFKKYTADDDPKFNDLNARSVVKINGKYKQKYARILIRAKKGVKF